MPQQAMLSWAPQFQERIHKEESRIRTLIPYTYLCADLGESCVNSGHIPSVRTPVLEALCHLFDKSPGSHLTGFRL